MNNNNNDIGTITIYNNNNNNIGAKRGAEPTPKTINIWRWQNKNDKFTFKFPRALNLNF